MPFHCIDCSDGRKRFVKFVPRSSQQRVLAHPEQTVVNKFDLRDRRTRDGTERNQSVAPCLHE